MLAKLREGDRKNSESDLQVDLLNQVDVEAPHSSQTLTRRELIEEIPSKPVK